MHRLMQENRVQDERETVSPTKERTPAAAAGHMMIFSQSECSNFQLVLQPLVDGT